MIEITPDTYIISDTHFGHSNILKYEPMRKVWLGDYPDRRLCELWNETIKPKDTVLHLGDYVWKGEEIERYSKKLNGQKYLLRGNHDRGAQIYLNNGFLEVIDYKSKGEAAYHIAQVEGLRILFSHYPIISDGFDDVHWRTLSKVFEEEECDINIHGHVHSMMLGDCRCINASLEMIAFAPIRLGTLLETHKERVG